MATFKKEKREVLILNPDDCQMAPELKEVQNLFPFTKEDKSALEQSIKEEGVREPVEGYIEKGIFYVLSGWTRRQFSSKYGKTLPGIAHDNLSPEKKFKIAVSRNSQRRHMTREEIRAIATTMLQKFPELDNEAIAHIAGSSRSTVRAIRTDLEQKKKIAPQKFRVSQHGNVRASRQLTFSEKRTIITKAISFREDKIDKLRSEIKDYEKKLHALDKIKNLVNK